MFADIDIFRLTTEGTNNITISTELPNQCPVCSIAYDKKPLIVYYIPANELSDSPGFAYAIYWCPHCENCFYLTYILDTYDRSSFRLVCYQHYPILEVETPFSEHISEISPQFLKIYHQAEKAESQNLTEICGLGYRKALEFLIKDFAIYKNPDKSEDIKTMNLSSCIKTYIDADNIKTLATRSAWLGNDESHYVRKHESYNFQDMKKFIVAVAYFISMTLITEEAADIIPK